ncbi:MAG: hypothetical protein EZS28_040687, partial [Streblomastix strix]
IMSLPQFVEPAKKDIDKELLLTEKRKRTRSEMENEYEQTNQLEKQQFHHIPQSQINQNPFGVYRVPLGKPSNSQTLLNNFTSLINSQNSALLLSMIATIVPSAFEKAMIKLGYSPRQINRYLNNDIQTLIIQAIINTHQKQQKIHEQKQLAALKLADGGIKLIQQQEIAMLGPNYEGIMDLRFLPDEKKSAGRRFVQNEVRLMQKNEILKQIQEKQLPPLNQEQLKYIDEYSQGMEDEWRIRQQRREWSENERNEQLKIIRHQEWENEKSEIMRLKEQRQQIQAAADELKESNKLKLTQKLNESIPQLQEIKSNQQNEDIKPNPLDQDEILAQQNKSSKLVTVFVDEYDIYDDGTPDQELNTRSNKVVVEKSRKGISNVNMNDNINNNFNLNEEIINQKEKHGDESLEMNRSLSLDISQTKKEVQKTKMRTREGIREEFSRNLNDDQINSESNLSENLIKLLDKPVQDIQSGDLTPEAHNEYQFDNQSGREWSRNGQLPNSENNRRFGSID